MIRRLTDAAGPLRPLALFRVVAGVLVLRHTLPFAEELRGGRFFAERFWVPYVPGVPAPAYGVYVAWLAAMVACGLAIVVGWRARVFCAAGAVLLGAHFFQNQLWYSNNRIFLTLCLVVLAFSPADRAIAPGRPGDAEGPLWTALVLRAQASLLYLASGVSKLLDPDWRSGAVLWGRLRIVARSVLPESLAPVLRPGAGIAAIATEIFLAVGLWFPRTRRAALWLGFWFHFVIELAFYVHVFSYLMLGTYLLVAGSGPPRVRRLVHRSDSPAQRTLADLLSSLDWLGKVHVEAGSAWSLTTPEGERYSGWRATVLAMASVPLLFAVVWPLTALTGRGLPDAAVPVAPAGTTRVARLAVIAVLALAVFGADLVQRVAVAGFRVHFPAETMKTAWALLLVTALSIAVAPRESASRAGLDAGIAAR